MVTTLPLLYEQNHEYSRILHFLQPITKGWMAKAYTCSSVTGKGIPELWEMLQEFSNTTELSGVFQDRRRMQSKEWFYSLIEGQLHQLFYKNNIVKQLLPILENQVMAGNKTITKAVQEVFQSFLDSVNTK